MAKKFLKILLILLLSIGFTSPVSAQTERGKVKKDVAAGVHITISGRPIYVADYEKDERFEDPPGRCVIVWKPGMREAFVYAVAITQGVTYEFILTEMTSMSDYEIKGRWNVLRDGSIRCKKGALEKLTV